MAGIKGRTGRHENRSNQWLKGTFERQRTDEVFAFKPKLAIVDAIKQDIEQREITKTEWLDMAVESMLGMADEDQQEPPGLRADSRLVREAIAFFLENKRVAIARERKAKKPDQKLIEQWEREIEELELILEDV